MWHASLLCWVRDVGSSLLLLLLLPLPRTVTLGERAPPLLVRALALLAAAAVMVVAWMMAP